MPFSIATAVASFREHSEDRLAVHHVKGGVVVVVADGAGGLGGGAAASDLALREVAHRIAEPRFNPFVPTSWANVLLEADGEIEHDRVAGETTAVIVALTDDGRIVGSSVGDSGAIVIRPDATIDDLTENQHRKRRLGSGRASPVTFERSALEGVLVVASDGLLAYARAEVIADVFRTEDLDETATALVDQVRLPNGNLQDDVAIVLIRQA